MIKVSNQIDKKYKVIQEVLRKENIVTKIEME
jgi:hypothetical protein